MIQVNLGISHVNVEFYCGRSKNSCEGPRTTVGLPQNLPLHSSDIIVGFWCWLVIGHSLMCRNVLTVTVWENKEAFVHSLTRGWLAFIFWGGKPLICPQVTHKTKVTQAKFVSSCSLGGNLIAKCNTNSLKLHIFPVYRITLNGFRTSFALSLLTLYSAFLSLCLSFSHSFARTLSLSFHSFSALSLRSCPGLDLRSKCSAT